MKFVDDPISVEVRVSADGAPQPLAFAWQGRRYQIADWGRAWVEGDAHHFLVMTPAHEVFELVLTPDGRWMLARAPKRSHLA